MDESKIIKAVDLWQDVAGALIHADRAHRQLLYVEATLTWEEKAEVIRRTEFSRSMIESLESSYDDSQTDTQ